MKLDVLYYTYLLTYTCKSSKITKLHRGLLVSMHNSYNTRNSNVHVGLQSLEHSAPYIKHSFSDSRKIPMLTAKGKMLVLFLALLLLLVWCVCNVRLLCLNGDNIDNTSVLSLITMRWLSSARARKQQNFAPTKSSKILLIYRRCRLTQVDLYNGRKMAVVVTTVLFMAKCANK